MAAASIHIPASVRAEHEAIHTALREATEVPGAVGAAAGRLAGLLHPHFVREEEIALPPLGLLEALAVGADPPGMRDVLVMTDALRKELAQMLQEHEVIRSAVADLKAVSQAQGAIDQERLAEQLALHALTEEEVLYPAAILVGDIVRARLGDE